MWVQYFFIPTSEIPKTYSCLAGQQEMYKQLIKRKTQKRISDFLAPRIHLLLITANKSLLHQSLAMKAILVEALINAKLKLSSINDRQKSRRIFQDLKFDQLNFENQEKASAASSRFGSIKTSPELETIPKHWAIASEGFPPGVTVDELKKYGRRKQLTHLKPQDNLRLEEGSLKPYKSEYKRRFVPFCLPKVSPTQEDNSKEKSSEDSDPFSKYLDSYLNYSAGKTILRRPQNNLLVLKDQPMESLTEKNSNYILFPHCERRKLLRRSTALKPEGEIACETEVRKEYVDFKNPEKARLVRKLPSLKLEGEYEPLTTEQRDKFIAYLLSRPRPVLEKKKTSLKMEGTFDFLTEKKLSYVRHELSERPRIRKRSTSLKLEGEVEFAPEYRNSFVDFPRTRPVTYKPDGKIRQEGEFESQTETKTQFVDFKNVPIPQSAKPENNLHIQGEMEISPEYRNNFVDFPRERPFLRRPFNQLKPEGNLELLTENSEKFSNSEGVGNSNNAQRTTHLNSDKNLNPTTGSEENLERVEIFEESSKTCSNPEQETEKGIEFGFLGNKNEVVNRRPLSLKQESEFFFVPEFRKSYSDLEREKNLKVLKDVKSNASSPRKKSPKGKTKLDFEDDKKSNPETLHRKLSIKRLKEGSSETSKERIKKPEEGKKKKETHQLRQNLRFSEIPPIDAYLSPKEFPAFKVLDVKGRLGCQSMSKDVLESDKSTSDEENPTYRLEVSNSGERSPGFYKSNRRIFPEPALDSKRLEEAEARAKQRAENYVKIVKSPEIPNSLLDEDKSTENRWRVSENSSLLSPQQARSFVVLDENRIVRQNLPEAPRILDRSEPFDSMNLL